MEPGVNASTHQTGHLASVWAVAISPDGSQLWSGSNDGTLQIHDIGSGSLQHSTRAHRGPILHIAFVAAAGAAHPHALTTSRDRTIKVWERTSHTVLQTITSQHGGVFAVRCDGQRLAVAAFDGRIGVASDIFSPLRWFVGHDAAVTDVVWARKQLVSASRDRTVVLWDPASGRLIRSFVGHQHWVTKVRCVAGGDHVISASEDGTLRRWDLRTGELIWRVAVGRQVPPIWGMDVSPDERLIAVGYDAFIRLLDAATGRPATTFATAGLAHRALAFSPDSSLLAAGRDDASVSVWDIANARQRFTVPGVSAGLISAARSGQRVFTGHVDGSVVCHDADAPQFPRHGRFVYTLRATGRHVVSGAFDEHTKVSDAATGVLLHDLEHPSLVFSVCPGERQRLLVAGGGWLRLWDRATGQLLRSVQVDVGAVHAFAELLGDSDTMLAACVDERGVVEFWNLHEPERIGECGIGSDMPSAMAASRDGRLLAVATAYGTVTLIDATAQARRWRVAALEEWIRDLRITADAVLCVAQDGGFAALDLQTGATLPNNLTDVMVAALAGEVGRDNVLAVDIAGCIHPIQLAPAAP